MNERIKNLRKALNLTQAEFSSRIGLTNAAISKVESGDRNISNQAIISICREFNVDEYWLRTGEGEMFVKVSEDEEMAAYVGHVLGGRDSDLQRSIISFMSKLPPETWEVIEAKAREVLNSRTETEKEEQT